MNECYELDRISDIASICLNLKTINKQRIEYHSYKASSSIILLIYNMYINGIKAVYGASRPRVRKISVEPVHFLQVQYLPICLVHFWDLFI